MVSKEDIRALWGNAIIEYPSGVVAELAIPADSRTFLHDTGLPLESELEVRFSNEVAVLEEFIGTDNLAAKPDERNSYRIGTDGGTEICLKRGSGEVVSVDPTGQLPSRFVNSSIASFIVCLGIFAKYRTRIARLADDEIDELIPSTEAEIRKADDHALNHAENWWSVVVEQMQDGLL